MPPAPRNPVRPRPGLGKTVPTPGTGRKGIARVTKRSRRKLDRDTIRGITRGDIRRLARRGGVKRISGAIYDDVRACLVTHLRGILKDCATYVEHAQRRTITVVDVIFALKRQGRPIYGMHPPPPRSDGKHW
ncbi:histone-fold-containing protein [Tirmania nivea]|nr:histone-fold-containing protein [Tirmania nivea]